MIPQTAIDLIKHYESLHDGDLSKIGLQPKLCPAGVWTVGYGRALTDPDTGQFLRTQDKAKAYTLYPLITKQQAETFLFEDLSRYEATVRKVTRFHLSDIQVGAATSLCYNIGIGNFTKSSVVRLALLGKIDEAADAFLLWNQATVNGKRQVLAGLVARRKSEQHLFLTGKLKFFN
jgi:lysozyme